MGETMMDELKRLIVEHMTYVRSVAESYDKQDLRLIAGRTWSSYYAFDWVLDTIAELEIKDAGEVSQEGSEAE